MAITVVGSNSQSLTQNFSGIVTAYPMSMAIWYKPTNVTGSQIALSIGSTSLYTYTYIGVGSSTRSAEQASNGIGSRGSGNITPTVGAWVHLVASCTSTSITLYINGVAQPPIAGGAAGTYNLTGVNLAAIGAWIHASATLVDYASGTIAYPAVWSRIALSQTDVNSLYNAGSGADPASIQTNSLASMSYLQLIDTYKDAVTGQTWTVNGSPTHSSDPFTVNDPPLVVANYISNVTQTSVTLNATIALRVANATAVGFSYGATSEYGSDIHNSGSFPAGSYNCTITGLSPGITYHWQAYATNETGTTTTGDFLFATLNVSDKGEVLFTGPQVSIGVSTVGDPSNLLDGDNRTVWYTGLTTGLAMAGVDCTSPTQLTRVRYTAQPVYEDLVIGCTLVGSMTDATLADSFQLSSAGSLTLYTFPAIRPSTGTLMNELLVAGLNPASPVFRYFGINQPVRASFADLDFIGLWGQGIPAQPVAPVISPPGGNFDLPVVVTITSLTTSANIYYTIDGTTPTSASTLYTGPFVTPSTGCQLNAIAIDNDLSTPSSRVTTSYFIIPSVLYGHQYIWDDRNYRLTSNIGCIFKDPISGYWYKYLSDSDSYYRTVNAVLGINVYRSSDLRNWVYCGNIMGSPIGSQKNIQWYTYRLQVFYCPATGLYVGWSEGNTTEVMRVWTSPYPDGRQPWSLVASYSGPNNACADGFMTGITTNPGDMGQFIDPVSGNTYIIYNYNNNSETAWSQLDPANFTNTLGPSFCATYPSKGEAHTVFYRNGTYFYLYSHFSGAAWNENHYDTATTPIGPWNGYTDPFQSVSGNPVMAFSGATPSPANCYCGQVDQVIHLPGRGSDCYILVTDDINPSSGPGGSIYYYTDAMFPITFTSSTSFTVSWPPGLWFDGITSHGPWSLDTVFPTVSGAPAAATNLSVSAGVATWTNNETSPANVYIDSASDSGFSANLSSVVVPSGSSSITIPSAALDNYYRVRTVNVNGSTVSSRFSSGLVPAVTADHALSYSSSSATLYGLITNERGGGNSTSWGFYYGLTTGYGNTVTINGSMNTGSFQSSITGLTPGTTYHYQSWATNPGGTGISPDATFSTPVVVPDLSGLLQGEAIDLITLTGLSVGNISYESSDTINSGLIISQSPTSGSIASLGVSVNIVISVGKQSELSVVPNLLGRELQYASRIIKEYGYNIGNITYQNNSILMEGEILSQDPAQDSLAPRGMGINIVISLGPFQPPVFTGVSYSLLSQDGNSVRMLISSSSESIIINGPASLLELLNNNNI